MPATATATYTYRARIDVNDGLGEELVTSAWMASSAAGQDAILDSSDLAAFRAACGRLARRWVAYYKGSEPALIRIERRPVGDWEPVDG